MKLNKLLSNKYFRQNFWEFSLILQDVLWIKKEDIYLKDIEISKYQFLKIKKKYNKFVKQKIPIEYVLWYTFFMWEKFIVNKNVLIPRPETEYLVKYALNKTKDIDLIFDIWTGSGVIWIMLGKLTWKKVILSDISKKALKIAKKNAKIICKNCKLEFILSDLWNHLEKYNWNKLICANLPYVDKKFKLDKYTSKEPKLALFAKENGLFFYKKLLNQIKWKFLFEVTSKQAMLMKKINWNFEILPTCHKNIKILYGEKNVSN